MPKKFLEDMVKAKRARHNNVSDIRPKIREPRKTKEILEFAQTKEAELEYRKNDLENLSKVAKSKLQKQAIDKTLESLKD